MRATDIFKRRSPRAGFALAAGAACAAALACVSCVAPGGAPSGPAAAGSVRYFGSVATPRDDVLRFDNQAEPETIDPGVMSGQPDGRIARILFEGLAQSDPRTLAPVPGLARAWDVSADGLVVTFHLRAGLRWSDGSPLTARDFAYAWLRALAPETGSRSANLLYPIVNAERYNKGALADAAQVGVQAADDTTLVVTLTHPTPYFLFLTTGFTFVPVPRAAIERWGPQWTAPEHLVCDGPFRLASHRPDDRFVFARNPRYWDAAHVRLDGIVAYSIDDLNTSMNLYKAGTIDWNTSGGIPSPYLPYLRGYADYLSGEYQGTYFYSVNVTRKPLDDVHVRRALDLAIDRVAIARDLLKGARRAWGGITPSGYPDYEGPPGVTFDPDAARRELALAGFAGGRGFPPISILFNTSEDHRRIAEAIQAMWHSQLGIPVQLQNQEWASVMQNTVSLRYDVVRRSWIGDYLDPVTFLEVLRSGDGNNRTGWADPRYDALLARAAAEVDVRRRAALLREAEQLALDQAAFLPILHYSTHELVKPYVRGIWHTALDLHPLTHVWIDHDWRAHAALAARAGR